MDFRGEIVFTVADENVINIDLGPQILPTKIVKKGDIIAIGRKSDKNRWFHAIKFDSEKQYKQLLEKMLSTLTEKRDNIKEIKKEYELVSIDVYIRSDYAQIGYSISNSIIKKLALLECAINFEILSFGMVQS